MISEPVGLPPYVYTEEMNGTSVSNLATSRAWRLSNDMIAQYDYICIGMRDVANCTGSRMDAVALVGTLPPTRKNPAQHSVILTRYTTLNTIAALLNIADWKIFAAKDVDLIDFIVSLRVNRTLRMTEKYTFNPTLYRLLSPISESKLDGIDLDEHRDLEWWEEVDIVYPLYPDSENMDENKSASEPDPVRESELLEREGEGPTQDKEQEGANAGENNAAARKKRNRSTSAKAASKKPKNQGPNNQQSGPSKPPAPGKGQRRQQGASRGRPAQRQQGQERERDYSEPRRLRSTQRAEREGRAGRPNRDDQDHQQQSGDGQPGIHDPDDQDQSPAGMLVELSRPPSPFRRQQAEMPPVTIPYFVGLYELAPTLTPQPARAQLSALAALSPTTPPRDEDITSQGLDREAHRRLLEARNPVPELQKKKKEKERTPPDFTYEITRADCTPLWEDYMEIASMLARARRAEDKKRADENKPNLKFDSKSLRSGDWIILAKNLDTKVWLGRFFNADGFEQKYRATLMSDQENYIKYALRVNPPDSTEPNQDILDHLFQRFSNIGYVRIVNDSRNYRDRDGGNETNKAYHKALKKRVDFDDKGTPYIKTIWLKMSPEANDLIMSRWEDLNFWFGVTEMELERAKDKKKPEKSQGSATKSKNKRRNRNVNDEEQGENMEDTSDEELVQVVQESEGTVSNSEPVNAQENEEGE